jgi:cardiolipin synthase A/B
VRTAPAPRRRGSRRRGSAGRAAAGAVSIGSAVGAAVTGRRALGPAEARIMGGAGVTLVALAILGLVWPRLVAVPVAVVALWVALGLLLHARTLRRERTGRGKGEDEG